jgi:hypothetical protein
MTRKPQSVPEAGERWLRLSLYVLKRRARRIENQTEEKDKPCCHTTNARSAQSMFEAKQD